MQELEGCAQGLVREKKNGFLLILIVNPCFFSIFFQTTMRRARKNYVVCLFGPSIFFFKVTTMMHRNLEIVRGQKNPNGGPVHAGVVLLPAQNANSYRTIVVGTIIDLHA